MISHLIWKSSYVLSLNYLLLSLVYPFSRKQVSAKTPSQPFQSENRVSGHRKRPALLYICSVLWMQLVAVLAITK